MSENPFDPQQEDNPFNDAGDDNPFAEPAPARRSAPSSQAKDNDNPFADEPEKNPFSEPAPPHSPTAPDQKAAVSPTSTGGGGGGAAAFGAQASHASAGAASVGASARAYSTAALDAQALRLKEEELRRREQMLEAKERELNLREARLPKKKLPNWPWCKPIIYHNIEEEAPAEIRSTMKMLYYTWYATIGCYVLNFLALFAAVVDPYPGAPDRAISCAIAACVMVLGPFLTFMMWYYPVYNAARRMRASGFVIFAFTWTLHLLSQLFWAIGIEEFGSAGFLIMLTHFNKKATGVAVMCLLSFLAWLLIFLFGLVLARKVYVYYQSQNMSLEQAKREAALDYAKSEAQKSGAKV